MQMTDPTVGCPSPKMASQFYTATPQAVARVTLNGARSRKTLNVVRNALGNGITMRSCSPEAYPYHQGHSKGADSCRDIFLSGRAGRLRRPTGRRPASRTLCAACQAAPASCETRPRQPADPRWTGTPKAPGKARPSSTEMGQEYRRVFLLTHLVNADSIRAQLSELGCVLI